MQPRAAAVGALAVALAFALGVFLGIAGHPEADEGLGSGALVAEDSVDVGFSRDMQDHHAQAVEMSVMVREATADRQVRTLALDILLTQQHQIGQMFGWLAAWGHPQASVRGPMAWMAGQAGGATATQGHEGHHGSSAPSAAVDDAGHRMPGMATARHMRQLDSAEGRTAKRIYLQLMVPHHEAGVEMAAYAVAHATQSQVRELAEAIVDSQSAELQVLRSMLETRGGAGRG